MGNVKTRAFEKLLCSKSYDLSTYETIYKIHLVTPGISIPLLQHLITIHRQSNHHIIRRFYTFQSPLMFMQNKKSQPSR